MSPLTRMLLWFWLARFAVVGISVAAVLLVLEASSGRPLEARGVALWSVLVGAITATINAWWERSRVRRRPNGNSPDAGPDGG